MKGLSEIRTEYSKSTLDTSSVLADPIKQFEKWFEEALDSKALEPNAMTLSTLTEGGTPTSRIVLLKGVEGGQFVFYTNYQSQKGRELEAHPACSLNFFWPELERQVRIEGVAQRVSPASSDAYFQSRPRASQIGAWASPQSALIKDRLILEQRILEIEKRYTDLKVLPRPKQWGGYAITPMEIEFWQGRPNRLHDRIVYTFMDKQWKINRLAP
ncbi:MAG TPA: pyridoxamine 5'-phosphate oxidase [Cyclobacteriaceae bacterium]